MQEIKAALSIPPDKRRFDSIAILIQGDAVCGASCFDGDNLLLATNRAEKTELVLRVQQYLKKIAQKSSEKLDHAVFWKHINQLKAELINYVRMYVHLFQESKTYQERFISALNKVTSSIKYAFQKAHDPAAFPFKMAEAIRKGKFIFLEPSTTTKKKRSLHAEMQIMDYLYLKNRKEFDSQNQIYLGISKKCCANCEVAIKAVNTLRNNRFVEVRGEGHGFSFAADIPVFLKADVKIRKEFLVLRDVSNLEEVFAINDKGHIPGADQLHTPSSSVYESTSVQEDSQDLSITIDDEQAVSSSAKIIKKLVPVVTPQKKSKKQTRNKKNKAEHSQNSPAVMFATKKVHPIKSKKPEVGDKKNLQVGLKI
jgi:hypothetical protein